MAVDLQGEPEHLRAIALQLLELGRQVDPVTQLEIDAAAVAVIDLMRAAKTLGRRNTNEPLRRPAGGCSLSPSQN